MSLFDSLWRAGALRTLDHAFAQSLRRLDAETPDEVLAAAALASLAVAQGHAAFNPAQPQRVAEGEFEWPTAEAWIQALSTSRWVARPSYAHEVATDAPLVLEHGLVYLRRYREYERRLATGLQRIAAHPIDQIDPAALAPLFTHLFPDSALTTLLEHEAADDDDTRHANQQARAAACALRHALLLVTGGPGTGKTTTTARLLVLLAAQARQSGRSPLRIALAAPTGRAAERMAESVRGALQALAVNGIEDDLLAALPTAGTTLHRLLGTIPDSPRFRHDADNPLPFDVVVADEASMIDLPLMAKLVDAIPDGARLILLGDPDQLPSVEAGDVLAAILSAADVDVPHAHTGINRDDARSEVGAAPQGHTKTHGFAGVRVHLRRGWRQSDALQLAPLAAAVREGDAETVMSLLRDGELANVQFHENLGDPLPLHQDSLLSHWRSLAAAPTPAEALALSSRLRILTAVREGSQGARTLNARIERLLLDTPGSGALRAAPVHFHGQLLIINENSYRHRLFNGDIGLCLRSDAHPSAPLVAWFPGEHPDHPRAFHPATLPAHESAFAMTVHKAQGSEFDHVWLLLPERGNRVLSRELIYTALTRARHQLHLAGSEAVIREALARHANRWSGLGWRLRG